MQIVGGQRDALSLSLSIHSLSLSLSSSTHYLSFSLQLDSALLGFSQVRHIG